jgi:hypothetical protein
MLRQTSKLNGIDFIDENGGGAGVRLKKPHQGAKRK